MPHGCNNRVTQKTQAQYISWNAGCECMQQTLPRLSGAEKLSPDHVLAVFSLP